MTPEENKEYETLLDKRETRSGLTNKEHKRYLILMNMAFLEGLPKIAKSWTEGFGLK